MSPVESSSVAGTIDSSTHSASAITAVTGIGTASVSHHTMVNARIAASACWLGRRSSGAT